MGTENSAVKNWHTKKRKDRYTLMEQPATLPHIATLIETIMNVLLEHLADKKH